MVKYVITTALVVALVSCGVDTGHLTGGRLSNTSARLEADATPVRVALAKVSGATLPKMSYSELTGSGPIGKTTTHWDDELPQTYLDSISAGLTVKTMDLKNSTLRMDKISIDGDFRPTVITGQNRSLPIPFSLTAGASIEVIRPFKTKDKARRALPFNFLNLPLSSDSALNLSEGTYISIPIKSRLMTQVNGRFLTKSFRYAKEIRDLLSVSATGITSGSAQATLIAEGNFNLQIVRLKESKVRVRVVEQKMGSGHARAGFRAGVNGRYKLIPFGKIDRAIDIKDRVINRLREPSDHLKDIEDRLSDIELNLTDKMQTTFDKLDTLPAPLPNEDEARQIAKRVTDDAIKIAEDSRLTVKSLRERIFGGVNRELNRIDDIFLHRVTPVTDEIKKYTDRTLRLNASVELEGSFKNQFRFIADYTFDLKDSNARAAYDHAVSGRSVWLGQAPGKDLNRGGLSDFTVAERVASEDETKSRRRVSREVLARADMKSRSISVNFKGPFASTRFGEKWHENRVQAKDGDGNFESWYAWMWEFEKNLKFAGSLDRNAITSGFLLPTDDRFHGSELGSFWFTWSNSKKGLTSREYMRDTFLEAVNLLGPVAFATELPSLYKGEFKGGKSTRLSVLYKKEAVERLFDSSVTTDKVLWRALQNMAESFDNSFGLPYNQFGTVPSKVYHNPVANEACSVVTKEWGRSYCASFANTFIENINKARTSQNHIDRMKVFEYFYKKNYAANKIGPRLFVRFLAEVSTLTQGSEAYRDFSVSFKIVNDENHSQYASPELSWGDGSEINIIRSLGLRP